MLKEPKSKDQQQQQLIRTRRDTPMDREMSRSFPLFLLLVSLVYKMKGVCVSVYESYVTERVMCRNLNVSASKGVSDANDEGSQNERKREDVIHELIRFTSENVWEAWVMSSIEANADQCNTFSKCIDSWNSSFSPPFFLRFSLSTGKQKDWLTCEEKHTISFFLLNQHLSVSQSLQ